MAKLFESHTTPGGYGASIYTTHWEAMTFTPAVSHTSTAVHLYGKRQGSPTGTVTVSIKAVDGSNLPTGADLSQGTTAVTNFPQHPAADAWVEITLTTYRLVANTRYGIVVRLSDGDSSNYLELELSSGIGYVNGTDCYSTDSGDNWTARNYDLFFKDYGAYESGELAGLIAIVEERLHYVDAYGDERYLEGIKI